MESSVSLDGSTTVEASVQHETSASVQNVVPAEISVPAESSVPVELSGPVSENLASEAAETSGSTEAASAAKDTVTFKTVQEKVDSWTNEEDGLTLGLFRVDPPKPMGTDTIAAFNSFYL